MIIKEAKNGEVITLNDSVDITDPCYDKNVGEWCRTTVNCKPGEYFCYYESGKVDGLIVSVSKSAIIHSDYKDALSQNPIHLNFSEAFPNARIEILYCEICNDSGLVGFFDNKPDFDADAWTEFLKKHSKTDHFRACIIEVDGKDGFFTHSGDGDGDYQITGFFENDELIAAVIDFRDLSEYCDELGEDY